MLSVGKLRKTGHEVHLGKEGEKSYIRKGVRVVPVIEKNNVFWVRGKKVPPDREQPKGMLNPLDTEGGSSSSSSGGGAAAVGGTLDAEEPGTEKVRMPKTPVVPTDLERELHEINRIPLRSWC